MQAAACDGDAETGEVPEFAACHLYQQDWGIPVRCAGGATVVELTCAAPDGHPQAATSRAATPAHVANHGADARTRFGEVPAWAFDVRTGRPTPHTRGDAAADLAAATGGRDMGIGGGIFLLVVGGILAFGVKDS